MKGTTGSWTGNSYERGAWYTGSQRGLLKEVEMNEWLERAKSSGVKVVELS